MATTINSYSVSLALNASDYIRNSSLSRQETAKLRREIESARDPSEKLARSTNMLDRAFRAGAIDIKVYTRLMENAEQKMHKAKQSADGLSGSLKGVSAGSSTAGSAFVALAGRLAGPVAIIETLRRSLTASFEIERATASLEVLMGSAAAAEQQLKDLRAIDAESPLSFEAGIQATRTLLSFGVAAEDVTDTLRMLGDITGADNERFKSMALAFAQVSAAGRLQGQDLRQMIDAGFNPLQEISRKTGESLVQLKERMEAGGISSQEMAAAFRSATGEGGQFNGMMDKLGDTASGKFGQATSQLQQSLVSIGDALAPLVVGLSNVTMRLVRLLDAPIAIVRKLAEGLQFMLAIVVDISDSFANLASGNGQLAWQFENTSKILNDIGKTADTTGEALQGMGDATVAAASKSDAAAAKFAENMKKILAGWQSEAKASESAFASQIDAMQSAIEVNTFGEGKKEEIDAIRNLFDMSDATQRQARARFDEMIAAGQMMSETALAYTFTDEQEAQLEAFRNLQKQTSEIEKQQRIQADLKKQEETRAKIAQKALENARAHFEAERQRQMQMRQTIGDTGAGSGMEAGSGEAARFMAEQANARIAGMVDIQGPQATDEGILAEAKKQAQSLMRQEQKQDRMLAILQQQLEAQQQNGFKRIR